tara:strand:- start:539 stop:973 length:435 start_codon:yes stop_codon:yes gene_type:complete
MNNKKELLEKRYPDATFPAPFAQTFDINFTKLDEGSTQSEVTVNKMWTNPFGIAHGGFLFSILDETLGSAACSVLNKPIYKDVKALSTTNHDIFFHSPASPGDKLIISANVVSCRKNMVFVEGNIKKEDETLVAESKGIWFIKR